MKKVVSLYFTLVIFLLFSLWSSPRAFAEEVTVVVLPMGGTLLMIPDSRTGALTSSTSSLKELETKIQNLPGLPKRVRIEVAPIIGLDGKPIEKDSCDLTLQDWALFAGRANELRERPDVHGIACLHGTDQLDAGAFATWLGAVGGKSVAVTGGLKPLSKKGSDGYRNIVDTVRVAASPEGYKHGVVAVAQGKIYHPAEIIKQNTVDPGRAFSSPGLGPIGIIDRKKRVRFYKGVPREEHTTPMFPLTIPNGYVAIVQETGDSGGHMLAKLIEDGSGKKPLAIVLITYGSGNTAKSVLPMVKKAQGLGIPVVVATEVREGGIQPTYASGHHLMSELGCPSAGPLTPKKAAILAAYIIGNEHEGSKRVEFVKEQFENYHTSQLPRTSRTLPGAGVWRVQNRHDTGQPKTWPGQRDRHPNL